MFVDLARVELSLTDFIPADRGSFWLASSAVDSGVLCPYPGPEEWQSSHTAPCGPVIALSAEVIPTHYLGFS